MNNKLVLYVLGAIVLLVLPPVKRKLRPVAP